MASVQEIWLEFISFYPENSIWCVLSSCKKKIQVIKPGTSMYQSKPAYQTLLGISGI